MTVVDNTLEHRFEIATKGDLAYLSYKRGEGRLVLDHTLVPAALRRRGIGGRLVEAALQVAVADGLVVVPQCPFVRDWLAKHPEVAEQVRIEPLFRP